jgi:hypothetical protein
MKRLVMLLALLPLTAAAQVVPSGMAFTGRLAQSGTGVNGTHAFVFDLYDAQTGGNSVWSESFSSLMVTDGVVDVGLGTMTPLTANIFTGSPRYLQITVDGTAMSPRLLIVSVPYAFRSDIAETANHVGAIAASDVVSTVTAGTGVQVNKTGNNAAISVDPTAVQSRVTGTCAAGQAIGTIGQNGMVTCNSTGITGVTAGVGLSGGGSSGSPTVSVDPTAVQARVTGTCSAGNAIASIAQNGGVACQAVPTLPLSVATQVSGVLPIANGGTGSATQNFVDLSTNQAITGQKSFSGKLLATSTPGGTLASLAPFVVNPPTANATDALAGFLVNGVQKATIDATGAMYANSYHFSPGVARTSSILATEFQPGASSVAISGNANFRSATSSGLQTLTAPLHLPDGAGLTGVYCYVVDNSPTYFVTMDVGYIDTTNVMTQYPALSTGAASASAAPVVLSLGAGFVVDNTANAYFVRFDVSDGLCGLNCRINSCIVSYTVNHAE